MNVGNQKVRKGTRKGNAAIVPSPIEAAPLGCYGGDMHKTAPTPALRIALAALLALLLATPALAAGWIDQ